MRSLTVLLTIFFNTMLLGTPIIIASLLGRRRALAWMADRFPRWWSRAVLAAAGVRMRLHGELPVAGAQARIYVCNHVSWFDVFALAALLPRYRFVAKKELTKLPVFGPAAFATVGIAIDRSNRKQAFESYRVAAEAVKEGASVVVYPEGTRGNSYSLRSFKKGPFVLAITAGVPIIPTVVHGTMEIQRRGSLRVRSGVIDVTFLEPIPTAGLTYDDRDTLMRRVWQRMAEGLERFGVRSDASVIDSETTAA